MCIHEALVDCAGLLPWSAAKNTIIRKTIVSANKDESDFVVDLSGFVGLFSHFWVLSCALPHQSANSRTLHLERLTLTKSGIMLESIFLCKL